MPVSLLASVVVMAGVIIVLLIAVADQDFGLLSLLGVAPVVFFLINRPDIWLAVIVSLWQSTLKFPQAPTNLSAFHIFSLGLVCLLVPYMMLKRVAHRISPVRKYVWMFALILIVTAFFRGIGVKALGSPLWGGASYVVLMIGIALFLMADLVNVSAKMWRNALIAMCLMSFFPTFAQLTYVFSGGRIYQQYEFIQPVGFIASTLEAAESGTGIARYNISMGAMLLYLPFVFYENPFGRKSVFISTLLIGISFISSGLSGYRSAIIGSILFLLVFAVFDKKGFKWKRGFVLGLGLALALLLAVVFAKHLPIPVQRSLSFIPSSTISWEAKSDALGTTTWRLDVWQRGVQDIPHYLLLGQGFAFNPRELEELMSTGTLGRDWAFVTRSYHHGLLSLVLILGLPGLLVGMGFLISCLRHYYRILRGTWSDPMLGRLYKLVYAQFVAQFIMFVTIYGDAHVSFPVFLFQATLLEGLAKSRETADGLANAPVLQDPATVQRIA